ncbi:hypothetical protein ACFS5L_28995 [Streptomyces phyllanthi]|uniref:Uncharacterized protein n=1 Tax=Streptomyces phyllanthi TaxID=1803180 RepID=A0A5N8W2F5_9ACTN|nr:hypothetical protein [Streptomyces phyllanthi]MPY41673.1 hypothetical protein [Streptomyces phyllanthi]
MANYSEDGSATCAFVMPSTIDGRSAHSADPLANDQDWHLLLWMQTQEWAGTSPVEAIGTAGSQMAGLHTGAP